MGAENPERLNFSFKPTSNVLHWWNLFSEHPEYLEAQQVKDEALHEKLKQIYVDTKDSPMEVSNKCSVRSVNMFLRSHNKHRLWFNFGLAFAQIYCMAVFPWYKFQWVTYVGWKEKLTIF